MKKILVPCDFSEPALQAYSFAMNIAARTNAEVWVLKVIDLPFAYETSFGSPMYYFDPQILKDLAEEARNNFERMKSTHPRKDLVNFTTLQGPITLTIRQFIGDYKIDLVVMGTHGATGLKEYWVGSNTEKIVRFSNSPVLAVRKSFELNQIKNVVFPTTLQTDQIDLISRLTELQSFFSATLHLLLVNTPFNMNRTKDQMDMMKEFAIENKLKDYTLNTRNDFYEQDGIINFAHETKADMIAMGTHGRRGLAHLFGGSVAEDVVNHVDCPIWTYASRK
ncbi:MAG: universal stress protein [Bacteroidota bacterium]